MADRTQQAGVILVVGRSGQVASALARPGVASRPVVALGRPDLDLTDPDRINAAIRVHRPAVVINAAAYTAVDKAETEPDLAFRLNAAGPGHLAEACDRADIPLVHLSTDYVFNGQATRPWREDDPIEPLGVYGQSKAEGEARVRLAVPRHVVLRTSWVFAGHGHNFVRTMLRLGRERRELGIVDDQHGGPTAARDIASACLAIADRLVEGFGDGYGTFHYSGAPATTWCGFARAVFEAAEPHGITPPEIKPITTADYPTPAARPANSVLDCGRIETVWGISQPNWRPALADAVADLLAESAA